MVSFTSLALFAASALAGPVARQIAIPENWNWQIENWEAGCSRSGCYYLFNITVPSIEGEILGVKARCSGSEQGYDNSFTVPSVYESCQMLVGANNNAAAKLSLRPHDGTGYGPQEIIVSFLFSGYEDRPAYNFSGSHKATYNQFVTPPINFTITPTQVFGVA
ncbi:hypothetical protein DM02DRAFT_617848 [Periconia macrospinosa]|uniref:Uncharacterized protein n=1 Tax=Periconia macrospinosa TaxID=97972 RepID=A0A2V1DBR4_9PLEO|nr:hypothetical protein DM02DRAFT_617848 [Periconia macrospinosa]